MFDEIEPSSRIQHTGRREVVVNGCWVMGAWGPFADEAMRAEIDGDKVSARSRRVERHAHRVAALPDRSLQADAVGVKHAGLICHRR